MKETKNSYYVEKINGTWKSVSIKCSCGCGSKIIFESKTNSRQDICISFDFDCYLSFFQKIKLLFLEKIKIKENMMISRKNFDKLCKSTNTMESIDG